MKRRSVMQPSFPERARSLQVLLLGVLLAGFGTGSLGCSSTPARGPASPFLPADTVAASETDRDSALAVLTDMRRSAIDSAFAVLDAYAVSRHVRTEQMSPAGTTTAMRSYTVRYEPGAERGTLQQHDSIGTFRDGGLFASFSSPGSPTERPENLASQALSDPPAYLAPRTREAFRYALRRDTLSSGTPVQVVAVQARSNDPGRDQGIRFARLTLDPTTRELIGITVVRAERALLFSEDSRFTLRLRRAPDGDRWVPHLTRFRASVDVPFRAPRQFRTVSAYYDYAS